MPADPRRPVGPRWRVGRTDVALAVLLFGEALVTILTLPGPVAVAAAIAVAVVQVGPVLVRRRHPRGALLLFAASALVQYTCALPEGSLIWSVLAFALVSDRARAKTFLTLVFLAPVVGAAVVWAVSGGHDLSMGIGFVLGLGLTLLPQMLIGALLGWATRVSRDREERDRVATERARVDAALGAERARMADDVAAGVVAGLHRLVELTVGLAVPDRTADERVTGPALAAVARESRAVLTGMRRALSALREPAPGDEPGPAPAPSRFARPFPLPTTSGLALVVTFAVVALGISALTPRTASSPIVARLLPLMGIQWDRPLTLVLLAVQVLALAWWRSAPVAALVVGTLGSIGSGLHASTQIIVETSWSVLVYAAARESPTIVSAVVTGACTVGVLAAYLLSPAWQARFHAEANELIGSFALVPVLWAVGALRGRARLHRADARRAALRERTHDAVESERHRVARELHDVVGHHVSAIAVQAGAAGVADAATRRAAVAHIVESGSSIRASLPALAALTPPDTAALTGDEVRRIARGAGVPVTVDVRGTPAGPGTDADLFAHRILTEAVTNVRRHAGPSATRVAVDHDEDAVRLLVRDSGPAAGRAGPGGGPGSGLGLVGMRERAELLGGELRAGPDPDGGWAVSARLPHCPDAAPRAGDGVPAGVPAGVVLRDVRPRGVLLEEEGAARRSFPPPTRPAGSAT